MHSHPYTFIDWVIGETVELNEWGISLGKARFADIDFVDDLVIFTKNLEVPVNISA